MPNFSTHLAMRDGGNKLAPKGFANPTQELILSLKPNERVEVLWGNGDQYVAKVSAQGPLTNIEGKAYCGVFKLHSRYGATIYPDDNWPKIKRLQTESAVNSVDRLVENLLEG